MFNFLWITIDHLELASQGHQQFLDSAKLTASEGAILPADFLKMILDSYRKRPLWTGFFALEGKMIIGSAMFKGLPEAGGIEIGYGVAPEAEGRGVATSLTAKMAEYAVKNGISTLRAHTLPVSPASQRVLIKNAFIFVGVFQDPEDGEVHRYEKRLTQ
jgi:[ribosomal protein S5]-alanine N-acetyltransferase